MDDLVILQRTHLRLSVSKTHLIHQIFMVFPSSRCSNGERKVECELKSAFPWWQLKSHAQGQLWVYSGNFSGMNQLGKYGVVSTVAASAMDHSPYDSLDFHDLATQLAPFSVDCECNAPSRRKKKQDSFNDGDFGG